MKGYTALVLTPAAKDVLLNVYKPKYENIKADHVTVNFDVSEDTVLPVVNSIEVIGYINDGIGLDLALVAVNGKTRRADGGTYHITISFGEGRKAKDSNQVILDSQHNPTPEGTLFLPVEPTFIPFH